MHPAGCGTHECKTAALNRPTYRTKPRARAPPTTHSVTSHFNLHPTNRHPDDPILELGKTCSSSYFRLLLIFKPGKWDRPPHSTD